MASTTIESRIAASSDDAEEIPSTVGITRSSSDLEMSADRGDDQQTADIASIIREIIGHAGWAEGNALALTRSGTGTRTAESCNGESASAPLPHIECAMPDDGAPAVDLDGGDSAGGPLNTQP